MKKGYLVGGAFMSVPFIGILALAYSTGTLMPVLMIYGWITSIICLIVGVCTIMNQLDRSK